MTKKKLWLTAALTALAVPAVLHAEDPAPAPEYGIKFGGFVKFDAYNDSRQVTGARDDMYFLYPAARSQITSSPQIPANFFAAGNPATATNIITDATANKLYIFGNTEDLNARGQTGMTAVQSRLSGKITGPDAFGAKVTGLIEGDFFGTTETQKYSFAMRHAWVNLDWGSSSLRAGQDWHPLFLQTGIFPGTLQFSPISPIHPFGRAPQIAFTQKMGDLKLSVHLLEQAYHADRGTTTTAVGDTENNLMLRRSKVPEIAAQLSYSAGGITVGGTYDHRELTVSDDTNPNSQLTGFNSATLAAANTAVGNNSNRVKMNTYQAFAQLKQGDLTVKASTTMGDSFVNLVGVGGIAVKQSLFERNMASILAANGVAAADATSATIAYNAFTKRQYSAIQARGYWAEIAYGKALEFGVVAGKTENLGARDEINSSLSYGRNALNLKQVITVAPRIKMTSGKTIFGLEYIYSEAAYMEDDKNFQGIINWAKAGADLNSLANYSTGSGYLTLSTADNFAFANDAVRNNNGRITKTYTVVNHRIQFSVQQNF